MNINADGYLSFISAPDEDTKSSYLLNVLATDLSGNQASYPVSITITADTTPPSIVCGTVVCPEQLVISVPFNLIESDLYSFGADEELDSTQPWRLKPCTGGDDF